MAAHPDPVCADPSPCLVEIQGVYDGALFHRCDHCRAMWHRWPEDHPLHAKAQVVMDRWASKETT